MRRRLLIGALVTVAILFAAVAVLFFIGTPQAAPPASVGAGGVAAANVPPADPSSPFAFQIPGCVCHSDDPRVVEEHAQYRMNQCFGCHADGVPEMGQ